MLARESFPRTKNPAEGAPVNSGGLSDHGRLPREELYGLTSQLRRACSSIAANLAEGWGQNRDAEFPCICFHRDEVG